MTSTRFALPLTVLSLAAGCATGPHGPGAIDERLAAAARSATAKEVEIDLAQGGAFAKVAVEDTSVAEVPAAVRKLAETTYPGGTLTEYEREVYTDGALIHEVEVKTADGKECEVSASEAGVLRYTECKMKPEELPEPVKKALEAAAPSPEIKEAELRKSADGNDEYRVEVKSGGRTWYLRFKADGTIIGKSVILEAEITIPVQ